MSNRKLKILVLEDEKYRQEWFDKIFSKDILVICDNAYEAIECLQNNDFDLIFLDRDLGIGSHPDNNGEKVAQEIARKNRSPAATIIVHSMNPDGRKNMGIILKKTHKRVYLYAYTNLMKMKRTDFH